MKLDKASSPRIVSKEMVAVYPNAIHFVIGPYLTEYIVGSSAINQRVVLAEKW